MNENNYNITLPYRDYIRLSEQAKELKELKANIKECFKESPIAYTFELDRDRLQQISKEVLQKDYLKGISVF